MKTLIAAIGLAVAGIANASTDCTYNVKWIGQDQTNAVVILMDASGNDIVGAQFAQSATYHKWFMDTINTAYLTGTKIIFRFTASSVSCTTYALRTDLQMVWIAPTL